MCCCACCGQGGAFSIAPPLKQKNEHGEVVRLNLRYFCSGFTKVPQAVKQWDLHKILPELQNRSVDRGVVERWFSQEKIGAVQQYGVAHFANECDFILKCLIPCLYCCFRPEQRKEWERYQKWDAELRKWQADFNKEVFEPRGMFIKSQSKFVDNGDSAMKDRWFAIALNADEAMKLKAEPHIFGDALTLGKSGLHEKDFCSHPPTW